MPARRGPIHWMLYRPGAPQLVIGVLLCSVLPVTFILPAITRPLLRAGILNTIDGLALFGGDRSGTFWDYVLNIDSWNMTLLLGQLASLPCLFVGAGLLWLRWKPE